jgi:hypothetical protein
MIFLQLFPHLRLSTKRRDDIDDAHIAPALPFHRSQPRLAGIDPPCHQVIGQRPQRDADRLFARIKNPELPQQGITSHSRSPIAMTLWRGLCVISQAISPSTCATVFDGDPVCPRACSVIVPVVVNDASGALLNPASASIKAASPGDGGCARLMVSTALPICANCPSP